MADDVAAMPGWLRTEPVDARKGWAGRAPLTKYDANFIETIWLGVRFKQNESRKQEKRERGELDKLTLHRSMEVEWEEGSGAVGTMLSPWDEEEYCEKVS